MVNEYGELSLYCIRILYTLFTARLHEETGEGSQQTLRKLGMLKHDGQQVKANQFIFKAILVNIMLAMSQGQLSSVVAQQLQHTLNEVFHASIAYAEGDRSHPFLEESTHLLATFFEST